ncbi:hypothetical protein JXI42_03640 [bacterium]|nr:hypothetical protein [bacterium]
MHEIEWMGVTIGWEIVTYRRGTFLQVNWNLYINDVFVAKKEYPKMNDTLRTSFVHDSQVLNVELNRRGGLFGSLYVLAIDDFEIDRVYFPFWKMKGWASYFIINFLFRGIPLVVVGTLLIGLVASVGIFSRVRKIVFRTEVEELNTSLVQGSIYYVDHLGKLMKYTPRTSATTTVFVPDSMEVRAISPDRKSIILSYPKGYTRGKYPLRKIFWMNLANRSKKLLFEEKIGMLRTSFTPDGNSIYLFFNTPTRTSGDAILADSLGNIVNLDDNFGNYAPYGYYIIGHNKSFQPWQVYDLRSGEELELDPETFPSTIFAFWWRGDTLLVKPFQEANWGIFVPLSTMDTETLYFKGDNFEYVKEPEPRIVSKDFGAVLNIFSMKVYDHLYIYEKKRLVWDTWTTGTPSIFVFSPDGSVFLATHYQYDPQEKEWYAIHGPNGAEQILPIRPPARLLCWAED